MVGPGGSSLRERKTRSALTSSLTSPGSPGPDLGFPGLRCALLFLESLADNRQEKHACCSLARELFTVPGVSGGKPCEGLVQRMRPHLESLSSLLQASCSFQLLPESLSSVGQDESTAWAWSWAWTSARQACCVGPGGACTCGLAAHQEELGKA